MDATRLVAGLAAVTMIVVIAWLLGRCSAPTAAEPAPAAVPVYVSHDAARHAAEALEQLAAWITSNTTTTVAVQRPATRSPAAAPTAVPAVDASSDRWDELAHCETGGNWAANTGNGYGGGVQFAHTGTWSTWRAFGGTEFTADPWDASREQQIVVAERVLASTGWKAWPGCARKNGWL